MRWLILTLALICSQAQAQTLNLLGAGSAANVSASAYQGPGDIIPSAVAWFSCARAYSAAFAATAGAICDVVDTSTGLVTCTFHVQTTGFVNPSECNATACAVACSVTKAYDQTGNGNHAANATLAQMPLVDFSGAATLPGMKCASVGTVCAVFTGNFTTSQPINLSMVYVDTAAASDEGFLGGGASLSCNLRTTAVANVMSIISNGTGVTKAATDNSYHSANGLCNGGSSASAINIDGSDSTGNAGTVGFATTSFRIHRAESLQSQGTIMEGGFWAGSAWNSTDRGNISTNQHSAAYGYNF